MGLAIQVRDKGGRIKVFKFTMHLKGQQRPVFPTWALKSYFQGSFAVPPVIAKIMFGDEIFQASGDDLDFLLLGCGA